MTGAPAFAITVLMLAAFALIAGGMYLIVRRNERRRGVLMLVAAAVFLGNVLIWTWPVG